MKLWLWYAEGTDEQIADACSRAKETLDERGLSIEEAYTKTVEANEESERDNDGPTLNAYAVTAWYAAEYAALARFAELTGVWPRQASLIAL